MTSDTDKKTEGDSALPDLTSATLRKWSKPYVILSASPLRDTASPVKSAFSPVDYHVAPSTPVYATPS